MSFQGFMHVGVTDDLHTVVETVGFLSTVRLGSPPKDSLTAVGGTNDVAGFDKYNTHARGSIRETLATGQGPMAGRRLLPLPYPNPTVWPTLSPSTAFL
jgi:hypothetical protein